MDSNTNTDQQDGKFLKNIGNKLADEEESQIKSGANELEGLDKLNEQVKQMFVLLL